LFNHGFTPVLTILLISRLFHNGTGLALYRVKSGTGRACPERIAYMSMFVKYARDLHLLNRVGLSLFRLIVKARENLGVLEPVYLSRKNCWHEGNDETAIGYEASWEGIFPRSEK
jgi:hypothetical protein